MNPDRLEESWLLFHITRFCPETTWHRNVNKEVDVEEICKSVYRRIATQVDERWKNHVCDEDGCRNRLVPSRFQLIFLTHLCLMNHRCRISSEKFFLGEGEFCIVNFFFLEIDGPILPNCRVIKVVIHYWLIRLLFIMT